MSTISEMMSAFKDKRHLKMLMKNDKRETNPAGCRNSKIRNIR